MQQLLTRLASRVDVARIDSAVAHFPILAPDLFGYKDEGLERRGQA
jgi:hypothetical protein